MANPEETRVKNLESELSLLKNQVQQTLLDIREHVLEFTNPFTAEARLVRAWQERTAQAAQTNLGGEANLESLLETDDDMLEEAPVESTETTAVNDAIAPTPTPTPEEEFDDEFIDAEPDQHGGESDDFELDLGPEEYEPAQAGGPEPFRQAELEPLGDDDWDDPYDDDGMYEEEEYGDDYDDGFSAEADYEEPGGQYDSGDRAYPPPPRGNRPDARVDEPRPPEPAQRDPAPAYEEPVTPAPEPPAAEPALATAGELGQAAPEPAQVETPAEAPATVVQQLMKAEPGMDMIRLISLVRWVDQNTERIGKDRVMVILDIHAMSGRISEETRDIVKRLCALDRQDDTRVPVRDVVAAMLTIDGVLDERQSQSQRLLAMLYDEPLGGMAQGGAGLLP